MSHTVESEEISESEDISEESMLLFKDLEGMKDYHALYTPLAAAAAWGIIFQLKWAIIWIMGWPQCWCILNFHHIFLDWGFTKFILKFILSKIQIQYLIYFESIATFSLT